MSQKSLSQKSSSQKLSSQKSLSQSSQAFSSLPLFLLATGALLSVATQAEARGSQPVVPEVADSSLGAAPLLAQAVQRCEDDRYPSFYARVATNREPLTVRLAPNSTVVGSIPKNWEVIVYEWSNDGAWARVSHHFSRYGGYQPNSRPLFANAPDFSSGWVSAAYLKDIGRFCDKPANLASLLQPEVLGSKPVEVQGDWLAAADSLADRW